MNGARTAAAVPAPGVEAADARAMRNVMSVDVEDYMHVSAFAQTVDRADWDRLESRVERNTRRLLEIFAAHKVCATFFVLGWVAQRHRALVREIAAGGHEVASHGMSHRLIYEQTPQEFRAESSQAKAILEDEVQRPVRGYRAASYSITRKTLWALDTLEELGFQYDSSIFPVHHDRYGIPGARREPHWLATAASRGIVEFPLTTKRLLGWNLPVSGGGYFRLFPYQLSRVALSSVNRTEARPFMFYLHPWEIDPGQPRVRAGWLSRFRHYNNLERCEPRLRALLRDFRFDTAQAVLTRLGLLH